MSANSQPWPGAQDTRPANGAHAGQMPRWATASATIASFATQTVAGHRDIYVPLATASAAGALSAAGFAKLATLQVPVLRLNYTAATDILAGAAIAATTWTDCVPNQNFTVSSAASRLDIEVRIMVSVTNGAALNSLALRAVIDSAGAATPFKLQGTNLIASARGGLGGGLITNVGLAAGAHTIKIQVYGSVAWVADCRCATQPNTEWAIINVWEDNP